MRIEKLSQQHLVKVKDFDCGNESINEYLKEKAFIDADVVTHLVLDENDNSCIGFFSLSCSGLYMDDSFKLHSYPAVEIKFFAIDKSYHGVKRKIDEEAITYATIVLFKLIYDIIYEFTENICGASRIILYATPQAVNFYKRAGFKNFSDVFLVDESSYLEGCIPLIFNYE